MNISTKTNASEPTKLDDINTLDEADKENSTPCITPSPQLSTKRFSIANYLQAFQSREQRTQPSSAALKPKTSKRFLPSQPSRPRSFEPWGQQPNFLSPPPPAKLTKSPARGILVNLAKTPPRASYAEKVKGIFAGNRHLVSGSGSGSEDSKAGTKRGGADDLIALPDGSKARVIQTRKRIFWQCVDEREGRGARNSSDATLVSERSAAARSNDGNCSVSREWNPHGTYADLAMVQDPGDLTQREVAGSGLSTNDLTYGGQRTKTSENNSRANTTATLMELPDCLLTVETPREQCRTQSVKSWRNHKSPSPFPFPRPPLTRPSTLPTTTSSQEDLIPAEDNISLEQPQEAPADSHHASTSTVEDPALNKIALIPRDRQSPTKAHISKPTGASLPNTRLPRPPSSILASEEEYNKRDRPLSWKPPSSGLLSKKDSIKLEKSASKLVDKESLQTKKSFTDLVKDSSKVPLLLSPPWQIAKLPAQPAVPPPHPVSNLHGEDESQCPQKDSQPAYISLTPAPTPPLIRSIQPQTLDQSGPTFTVTAPVAIADDDYYSDEDSSDAWTDDSKFLPEYALRRKNREARDARRQLQRRRLLLHQTRGEAIPQSFVGIGFVDENKLDVSRVGCKRGSGVLARPSRFTASPVKIAVGAPNGDRSFIDGYYQALSTMSWQGCPGNARSEFDSGYSRLPLNFRTGDADDEDSNFNA